MTSSPLPDTLAELNDLCQFFKEAEQGLKTGSIVDMQGIDVRVSRVCQAVQDAMPDQQQDYLPELTILINLLNDYEQSLRALHAAMAEESSHGQP